MNSRLRAADVYYVKTVCSRLLVSALLAWTLAGCTKNAPPATVGAAAHGPTNGSVADVGTARAPLVTDAEKAEILATVAAAVPARRTHLRYALALDDNGQPHLAVYDDLGLGSSGKVGRKAAYVVFKVLNMHDGSHYDPEQNALIAAIPPPPDRDMTMTINAR